MESRAPAREAGFSLLEGLITMLLIAIAMLGAAQLQAYSMKVNQAGQFRSQAVILGMDLLERVEANNEGAIAGAYVATLPTAISAPGCNQNQCSAAQMATYDLYQFQEALRRQLPDTSATITFAGTGPYTYTVLVSWRERAARPKSSKTADDSKTEAFSYTVSRTVYNKASAL